MNALMRPPRRWRRGHRRAISEIVGTIFLVALTLTAGIILWSFRLNPAPAPPVVSFQIHSGGSNPVWGDPTDCQPRGTWSYPIASSQWPWWTSGNTWGDLWFAQCYPYNANNQPQLPTGNFSLLNSSELIVSAVSSNNIPLSDITLTFVCDNSSSTGGHTILVSGSLAAMRWFPGQSIAPTVSNPPTLGYCGNFNASGYGGGAFGTLYNRLGIFVPLTANQTVLQAGDTFILYIHNGGWPLDYMCVDPDLYGYCYSYQGVIYFPGTQHPSGAARYYGVAMDEDDYHGAPPWCFTSENACTIYLTYTGNPATTLATIPVYSLAPPTSL